MGLSAFIITPSITYAACDDIKMEMQIREAVLREEAKRDRKPFIVDIVSYSSKPDTYGVFCQPGQVSNYQWIDTVTVSYDQCQVLDVTVE